jgi:hypothetical protein
MEGKTMKYKKIYKAYLDDDDNYLIGVRINAIRRAVVGRYCKEMAMAAAKEHGGSILKLSIWPHLSGAAKHNCFMGKSEKLSA